MRCFNFECIFWSCVICRRTLRIFGQQKGLVGVSDVIFQCFVIFADVTGRH